MKTCSLILLVVLVLSGINVSAGNCSSSAEGCTGLSLLCSANGATTSCNSGVGWCQAIGWDAEGNVTTYVYRTCGGAAGKPGAGIQPVHVSLPEPIGPNPDGD